LRRVTVLRMTPLEVACGSVLDFELDTPPLPAVDCDPLTALERASLPALQRPPCIVSFSGGLDSSLVLAAAVQAARRAGLADPIPVTCRFAGAPDTEESRWQEVVVRHLDLDDWVRLEDARDLDVVGPIATGVLLRHGLLWPPNAHFHVPILAHARGGALLSGYGGDHLLTQWPMRRVADVLARRTRPVPRDALRLALAAMPRSIRRAWTMRRSGRLEWLTPQANRDFTRTEVRIAATAPRAWAGWIAWRLARRGLAVGRATFDALAADVGARMFSPLLDPVFAAALAREGGRLGSGDRGATLRRFAAQALPAELLARRDKARFGAVFWSEPSRRFGAGWDGSGVDTGLVDAEALRRVWAAGEPDVRTASLLQGAWLAAHEKNSPRRPDPA